MTDKNSTTVEELRFQDYSNGEVHVHDDSHSLKFVGTKKDFKKKVEDALQQLKKSDGIIKIEGKSKEVLYLCKDEKSFHVFVAGTGNKRRKLTNFIKGL